MTVPETVPPPIVIFPLASIFPPIVALEPAEITVPVDPAAESLPVTTLLFAS